MILPVGIYSTQGASNNEHVSSGFKVNPTCNMEIILDLHIKHAQLKLPIDTQYAIGVLHKWYFETEVNWLKHNHGTRYIYICIDVWNNYERFKTPLQ